MGGASLSQPAAPSGVGVFPHFETGAHEGRCRKNFPSAVTTERGLENPPGAGPANWTELPKTVGGLCQRGAGGHAGLC